MAILRAVIVGIAGLLIGYFVAAFASNIVMGWLGVSDFEGGRGMAAVFAFGPLGGLLGLIAGIWLGLRRRGGLPVGKALARAGIAVLAIVAIAAGGLAVLRHLCGRLIVSERARRDADDGRVRGDIGDDDGVGTDARVVADGDRPEDLRPGADMHVVADRGAVDAEA